MTTPLFLFWVIFALFVAAGVSNMARRSTRGVHADPTADRYRDDTDGSRISIGVLAVAVTVLSLMLLFTPALSWKTSFTAAALVWLMFMVALVLGGRTRYDIGARISCAGTRGGVRPYGHWVPRGTAMSMIGTQILCPACLPTVPGIPALDEPVPADTEETKPVREPAANVVQLPERKAS